jgi:hypothetical protein
MQTNLIRWTQSILGYLSLGIGVILALIGIGDFLTGSKISNFLIYVSSTRNLPKAIGLVYEYLAELPLAVKTGGGSSLIAAGRKLVKHN